jgi:hypothetical protein
MADGVDGSMNSMQASDRQPIVDCPSAEAQLDELAPRDHPMLPRGNGCDELVTWSI